MKSTNFYYLINSLLILTKLTNLQNISLLSNSIGEIIEQFYTKNSKNIDIIDFSGSQSQLVTEIAQNLNNLITVTILKTNDPQIWTKNITTQTILLFGNFSDLKRFSDKDLLQTEYINPIRILVYCQNASELEFSQLRTDLLIPHFYYFIIFSKNYETLKLFTFENRNDLLICHEIQQLQEINQFSAESQKWINDPIFPKKYKNFHGCFMKLGSFFAQTNFIRFFIDLNDDYDFHEYVDGPLVWVLKDIQQQLNCSIDILVCSLQNCVDVIEDNFFYNIIHSTTLDGHAISNPLLNYNVKFVILNIQCT